MTIFSFKSPVVIFPVTMLNIMNGTTRSWLMEVAGRKGDIYGMEAKVCPVGWQKNSMKTAAKIFMTSPRPPCNPPAIRSLPTPMQISTSSLCVLASGGKPPSQSPSVWRCPTWVTAGTCAPSWCIYQTERKQSIRWPLWNGKPNAHTTSLKHSSTASFFTQLWSSQPDAHTLQTWRPCLPPLITVLSFCMGLPEIPLTIWPGGSTSLGTQTSSSPSQGPTPSLSTEHIQMPVLALVWLSQ